jgi:hypothetical protein
MRCVLVTAAVRSRPCGGTSRPSRRRVLFRCGPSTSAAMGAGFRRGRWRGRRVLALPHSRLQEAIHIDICLAQDRSKRAFRHITGMVGNGSVAVGHCIKPDLVASGSLAIELESACFQLPHDLPVAKAGKTTHSGRDHNRIVAQLAYRRQRWNSITIPTCFNQFASNVACDVERLGDGPPLRNETGKFVRCRQE